MFTLSCAGADFQYLFWLTKSLSFAFAEDVKELTNSDAPENNQQFTTVYVGNLAPEARNNPFLLFEVVVVFTFLFF